MRFFCACIVFTLISLSCFATEIRVKNDSDVAFSDVVVGSKHYGDIQPHTTTAYQSWKLAYHTASFSLVAGSNPIRFQPMNYLREGQLGAGKYTYVLRFKSGALRIHAEKDDE